MALIQISLYLSKTITNDSTFTSLFRRCRYCNYFLKKYHRTNEGFNSLAEVKTIVTESVRKDQLAFGHNYWQSVLKLELLESDDFMIEYE